VSRPSFELCGRTQELLLSHVAVDEARLVLGSPHPVMHQPAAGPAWPKSGAVSACVHAPMLTREAPLGIRSFARVERRAPLTIHRVTIAPPSAPTIPEGDPP
jgi:hypothetical protein